MLILAIGHKARHGKDTAATAILQHASCCLLPTLRVSWADTLYQETNEFLASDTGTRWLSGEKRTPSFAHILSLPDWVTPTHDAEKNKQAPYGKHSLLLQWWGTEYRRAQDPDYWVKKGIERIAEFGEKNPNGVVCIPDTRFYNEVDAIKAIGGYTLNVTRVRSDGSKFWDPGRDPGHISEVQLDKYNWDFRVTIKDGEAALTGELAITIFEYIRGLKGL